MVLLLIRSARCLQGDRAQVGKICIKAFRIDMPAAAHRAIIPTVIGEQVKLLRNVVQKPFLERPACLSFRHVPVSLVLFLPFCHSLGNGGIKASGNALAFREEHFGVDIECPSDAFEKVEGGRELGVLDLAHMAAAHVGPMSKLLLAEAAGASQVLDVQCYTVPQGHARETDTLREISPRDICYIRRCREEFLERREIAGKGYLPRRRSRDDPSRKHYLQLSCSFGKGRHRQYRCRQSVVYRKVVEDEFYSEIWGSAKNRIRLLM